MRSQDLKTLFRQEMADTAEPYLWSDTEVYSYIDDAQKMFCRLTDGISDATTAEVVDIAVSVGATWLELHPAILKIRGANRTSDGAPLDIVNFEDMARRGVRFDGSTGTVCSLVVGMEENKLRLARAASVADTIKLLVFRLPLLAIDGGELDFEIAEQHHIHLLSWVKHLALRKQDSETFDRVKSDENEALFRRYCKDVQREQQMKRHKIRTVAYGGL